MPKVAFERTGFAAYPAAMPEGTQVRAMFARLAGRYDRANHVLLALPG